MCPFVEEHVGKQRPRTQIDYRSIIQNDILPALGRLMVAAVEFEHVERLHANITKRAPVRANRALAVTATMFGLAVRWKLRADNPCKGVTRNREHGRRTAALAGDPNQLAANILRLLLLTGARKGEVLSAQWDQIDLAAGVWTKPHTMTKQERKHAIPLSAPARQLLERLHKRSGGSPWVFPGRDGGAREDLKYAWARICKAAGITGLRVHDLRHSYASHLVSAGFSLPVIGSLLGHSTPMTTARYSHLIDDVLRTATERVGAIISGVPSGEILPLKGRRP